MSHGITISKETFQDLRTADAKLNAVFDVLACINEKLACQRDTCATRLVDCKREFDSIKKRKWIDRAASAGGGALGGFLAVISNIKFNLFG